MEELNNRYMQLISGYKRLRYMVKTYQTLLQNSIKLVSHQESIEENELITHRDALIKRFEFCYELTWKFFKILLRERFSIEVANPRVAFQECNKQAILTLQETEILLSMIRSRNETIHIYDEELANAMSKNIIEYNAFFQNLEKKLFLLVQGNTFL